MGTLRKDGSVSRQNVVHEMPIRPIITIAIKLAARELPGSAHVAAAARLPHHEGHLRDRRRGSLAPVGVRPRGHRRRSEELRTERFMPQIPANLSVLEHVLRAVREGRAAIDRDPFPHLVVENVLFLLVEQVFLFSKKMLEKA